MCVWADRAGDFQYGDGVGLYALDAHDRSSRRGSCPGGGL